MPEQRSFGNVNPWVIAIAVMLGTFMEVLDTTVVNVSLKQIAGNLSASTDEATWVLTSYLVANAIVLPLTGWLANHFGRRRILLLSVGGFTLFSVLCGLAPNLPSLIVFRVLQGATGGGLQPLSQAIMLEAFPAEKRGKAMAFWALGIVVAPMLGPVLGGWITDSYSWRWLFYINVPVGIAAAVMASLFIFDPPYIRRSEKRVDYWGIGLLALGIGALQIMLDKGQEEDWLSSHFIVMLAALTGVGLIGFIVREWKAENPVVNLRVFQNRTYSTGVFLMTVLGFILYASTVLLPVWLQTLMGYSALEAGMALLPRGLGSFLFMPIVGILMSKVEPRKLLAVGMATSAFSLFLLSRLNMNAGYWEIFWPQLLQGTSMGLLFVPLTTITNGPIPKHEMGNATSLFNLMRNIGASIGIASVTTLVARNVQKHSNDMSGRVTAFDPAGRAVFESIRNGLVAKGADIATATKQAYAALFGLVQQQAAMLSYIDAFFLLAMMFVAVLPLVLIMKKPKSTGGPTMGAH
ncbi:MAG TPA: DHA2 family efflux MFS transporter permease subunit [Candidatus Saccharimonadales bacterium]|jgi:DHA2 family multidrug resistance protein|nr:DHA2 family efflux MFS transporter permease subunit [Candidatus Saccharimonadales bacterium]